MSLPNEIVELADRLSADFHRVWELVEAEIQALEQSWPRTYGEREHRLNELEIRVRTLMAHADEIATQNILNLIQGSFTLGAVTTNVMAGVVTEAIPIGAAAAMARDTLTDILAATQHVNETTKTLIQTVARDDLLMHTYLGQTPEETARHMRKTLTEHGVHAVTYKNGAEHGLGSYTEMLVRTKTAEAYAEGTLQAAEGLGIEYWEVLDGPGCGWTRHDDPVVADGLIVTTDEAREYPISHPNCRRTTVARIDIETLEDAQAAGRLPDDVWESSRAVALKMWEGVKLAPQGEAQTVQARIGTLSAAERDFLRVIQSHAS